MVAASWPAALPQNFLANGFSDSMEDGLIKDNLDRGPPLYRRRSTASPHPFSGQMTLTSAEWAELESFFCDTLYCGALRFTLPAQGTTNPINLWTARFTRPPERQSLDSDDLWLVSLQMERLNDLNQTSTGAIRLNDPDIFYAARIIADQVLTVPRLSDADAIYAPSIVGPLHAPFYSDADVLYTARVQLNQTLTTSLLSDADSLYTTNILGPGVFLADLYTNTNAFYVPFVEGPLVLTAGLHTNTNAIYGPLTERTIGSLARYQDTDVFYAPHVSAFSPSLYSDADAFFVPTVTVSTPFSLTQVDTVVSTVNDVTAPYQYTFLNRGIGAADSTRQIIVGVCYAGVSSTGVSSITVAGISATQLVATSSASTTYEELWIAAVPTGITGTVVVTIGGTSASISNCAIVMWRMSGGQATPTATASDNTFSVNDLSASLTIPTGGGAVGLGHANNATAPRTWTWTNMTEVTDATLETNASYTSALSTTAGTLTRTVTASGTESNGGLVLAAFQP